MTGVVQSFGPKRDHVIVPPAAAPFVALIDGYVALGPLVPGWFAVPVSVAVSVIA